MKVPAEAIEDGEQGTKRFRAKRDAILSCLRARYVNVLITDERTAGSLLEEG